MDTKKLQKIVIRITNYKGKIIANWKIPKTKKQFGYATEKLLKLYYRCKENHLLTKDLVVAIKHYSEALYQYAETKAWLIAKPEYARLLKEVTKIQPEDLTEEIVAEKIREYEKAVCSFCKVQLKFPARVIYRKEEKIVKISEPIGIKCLNYTVGKINDLTVEIKALVENINLEKQKTYNKSLQQLSFFVNVIHSYEDKKNYKIQQNKQQTGLRHQMPKV